MSYFVKCSHCAGSGILDEDSTHIGEGDFKSTICPSCHGQGTVEGGREEPPANPIEITPPSTQRR